MAKIRRGPSYEVTGEWKDRVEREMKRRRLSRSDLATSIGVSRTAITDLLGKSDSSTLVPLVEELLWPHHAPLSDSSKMIGQARGRGEVEVNERTGIKAVWHQIEGRAPGPTEQMMKVIVFQPVADQNDPGDPEATGHHRVLETTFDIDSNDIAGINSLYAIAGFLKAWRRASPDEVSRLMGLVDSILAAHRGEKIFRR